MLEAGIGKGIPEGVVITLINATATFAQVMLLFMSLLLDPSRISEFPSFVRKDMLKESKAQDRLLLLSRRARAIPSYLLRNVYACLDLIPSIVMIIPGLMLGAIASVTLALMGSLVPFVALVAPHSIFEIPAILLGGALPRAGYYLVQENLERGETEVVFERLRAYIRSKALKVSILIALLLLVVAGIIEAHFTRIIASWMGVH